MRTTDEQPTVGTGTHSAARAARTAAWIGATAAVLAAMVGIVPDLLSLAADPTPSPSQKKDADVIQETGPVSHSVVSAGGTEALERDDDASEQAVRRGTVVREPERPTRVRKPALRAVDSMHTPTAQPTQGPQRVVVHVGSTSSLQIPPIHIGVESIKMGLGSVPKVHIYGKGTEQSFVLLEQRRVPLPLGEQEYLLSLESWQAQAGRAVLVLAPNKVPLQPH